MHLGPCGPPPQGGARVWAQPERAAGRPPAVRVCACVCVCALTCVCMCVRVRVHKCVCMFGGGHCTPNAKAHKLLKGRLSKHLDFIACSMTPAMPIRGAHLPGHAVPQTLQICCASLANVLQAPAQSSPQHSFDAKCDVIADCPQKRKRAACLLVR
eukprot:1160804-Pelagomonas_calceolata.AAC.15